MISILKARNNEGKIIRVVVDTDVVFGDMWIWWRDDLECWWLSVDQTLYGVLDKRKVIMFLP